MSLIILPFGFSVNAQAVNSLNTLVLSQIKDTKSEADYYFLNFPNAIYANDNGVYIADGDMILLYDQSGINQVAQLQSEPDLIAVYENLIITLEHGVLKVYDSFGAADNANGNFTDFCLYNNKIFAINNGILTILTLDIDGFSQEQYTYIDLNLNVSKIAVINDSIYLTSPSPNFKNKDDIYVLDSLTPPLRLVYQQTDKVSALAAYPQSNILTALTTRGLQCFFAADNSLSQTAFLPLDYGQFMTCSDRIFVLTDLNGLISFDTSLSSQILHFYGASGEQGFFNSPYQSFAKNGNLLITDTINNRIALYNDSLDYIGFDFIRPQAVVCDNKGNIYVAHNIDKLEKFNSLKQHTASFELEGYISDLAIDAAQKLHLVCEDNLFILNGDTFEKVGNTPVQKIKFSVSYKNLFALSGRNILIYQNGSFSNVLSLNEDFSSFCVDINDSIYILKSDCIDKYVLRNTSYELLDTCYFENTTLFDKSDMFISLTQNKFISYGDLIITDTYRHRILKTSGENLEIGVIDTSFSIPDFVTDNLPSLKETGIIRTALTDLEVFERPAESPVLKKINKNDFIIMAQYSIAESDEYSLIITDDTVNNKLIAGYVYKDSLSASIQYSNPPANTAKIINNNSPLYKFPSLNAPVISGFNELPSEYPLTLLTFAHDYHDNYGAKWYRVQINDDYEGYILQGNASIGNYEPDFILPKYNAEIIEINGSKYAPLYKLVNNEYILIEERLETGTKVEIIGTFDSSKPYTLIKYYNENYGTLECYIQTQYLHYEGTNMVIIIACILLLVVLGLLALFIIRIAVVKRKRGQLAN